MEAFPELGNCLNLAVREFLLGNSRFGNFGDDILGPLAHHFNVPEFIIGITIISLGTVLPELITGIIASIKGEEEIEVGNALGSFIFNLMFIFGFLTLLVQRIDIPLNLLYFEIPLMLAVCVLLIPLMRRNFVLGRLEGALLILVYAIYLSKQLWF